MEKSEISKPIEKEKRNEVNPSYQEQSRQLKQEEEMPQNLNQESIQSISLEEEDSKDYLDY